MNTSIASASFIVERLGASAGMDWRTMPMIAAALLCGSLLPIRAEFLSGKKICKRVACGSSCKRPCSRNAALQQRLEAARKGGQQLALVGVRHFQPQRAECAGQRGDRIEYRRQPVAFRQCCDDVVQADQLAREDQFAVRQRLFVERDDDIAAVGDDRGLLCGDDGFLLLRLAQRFLRAILLEAGAAIQQPVVCVGFCMFALWHRLGGWPEGGNIRAFFFAVM